MYTQHLPTTSASMIPDKDHESTIVGPSDHYGIHQYGSSNRNTVNNNNNDIQNAKPSNNHRKPQEETKVCVIVDSRTPVIFKIPLPPSQITLADLKLALPAIDKPEFKYFFKSTDEDFGIVKEEIQEDDGHLPTYRNRVVAWVVTPGKLGDELTQKSKSETGTCNMTYSNTSYDEGSSSFMTSDVDSTSYFTETDDDSNSCSQYSETTCDTFISQRKSRHYKSNTRSPQHHYLAQKKSNSPHHYNRQINKSRDSDDSSSSSSPTSYSSDYSDATAVQCLTVHLVLDDKNFLGLHIHANASDGIDEGIFVDSITENSALALDGRLERGDKLIQVNDINIEELTNEEAVKVLKEAVIKRGSLKLVVAKFIATNKNDDLDGIPEEAIHPIDTAAWVAHAQAITIPSHIHDQANSATSSPSFGSNAQDTDCIRPSSAGMIRFNSGLRLNKATTDIKELIQYMKLPEIGLNIRNREWLKIQIPKAFLGSDLVNWLERNVYGFKNNREAKKFASRMMKDGHIRDPISKKSFSSKSYYTFVT